jgi:hypothetical protein
VIFSAEEVLERRGVDGGFVVILADFSLAVV